MSHPKSIRFHDLDALRAVAMLLGIVLHAALSFTDLPIWPAQDINRNDAVFGTLNDAIHGFRMPLFFLVSGFFTAMLAQRRGLRALARHRTKRVLLPMVIGWFIFGLPMYFIMGIGAWLNSSRGQEQQAEPAAQVEVADTNPATATPEIDAAAEPDTPEAEPDAPDEDAEPRSPDELGNALRDAALRGQADRVRNLIAEGADIAAADHDGNRAIHSAAFLGHADIVELLIENGADPNAKNNKGDTPMSSAHAPWWLTEMIAGMIQIEVDQETVQAGRAEVIEVLEANGAEPFDPAMVTPEGILGLLAFIPIFHHLWFLYYLLWLVAFYILGSKLLRSVGFKGLPDWLLRSPVCLLWLVPLTFWPQLSMNQGFGPDTATGILPWPPIIGYYAIFFFFGAACFGREHFRERTGRFWPLCLVAAVPPLLVGLGVIDTGDNHVVYSAAAAVYAWLVTFAFIGFFRRFFHGESRHFRYISDASYWLYLAHLPLVMVLQIIVAPIDLPAWIKFLAVLALTYLPLIVLYEYIIRYTWAGTLLNGKKVRPAKADPSDPTPPSLPTDLPKP